MDLICVFGPSSYISVLPALTKPRTVSSHNTGDTSCSANKLGTIVCV